jgi:protein-tyrosine sulfotransferase
MEESQERVTGNSNGQAAAGAGHIGELAPRRSSAPAFVLTTSRSGSTLLRFIIDSHPDFACPPETNLAGACAHLARAWDSLEQAVSPTRSGPPDHVHPSETAAAAIRETADRAYSNYLLHRGKSRWCDKSLDSYQFADILIEVFPDAKFLILTRHCMDVIASGVEVCPWGVSRFGFDPYVAQFPGNSVAAIGSYWFACTQANLAFAEAHPESCHKIRYEDLVTSPEETVAAMFSFLGADYVPGSAEACLRVPHDSHGPGDGKIWFTGSIKDDSVGRGVIVPADALPAPLRHEVNSILARLNYRTVDESWHTSVGRFDPRADRPSDVTPADADESPAVLRDCVAAISSRLRSRQSAGLREITANWPSVAGVTIRLVVQADDGETAEVRWRFDDDAEVRGGTLASSQAGDLGQRPAEGSDQSIAVVASPDSWLSLLAGRANLITEMTTSRMRFITVEGAHRLRVDEIHVVADLLGLNSVPVRHGNDGTTAEAPLPVPDEVPA